MALSIIIVSWNVKDRLRKCLESIYLYQGDIELEIFVVDNNSQDGSAAMIQNGFPKVKLIANQKNRGFARANNQALRLAEGDYVLLLNPDTEILPGTLQKSLNFLAARPDGDVMGCQILNPDKSVQPSVRRWPRFWPIFLIFLKLPKLLPNLKAIDKYLAKDFDYAKTQTVDQVMGAFMLIKKEWLEKIGLLDERFFVWFEEVDFCRRVHEAGGQIYYCPEAQIIHYGGQSFGQEGVIKNQWRFFMSALKYFIRIPRKPRF